MFYKPYYIIHYPSDLDSFADIEKELVFVLLIDLNEPQVIKDFFEAIYRKCNYEFCFLIKTSENELDQGEIVEHLVLLSFHCNYVRTALNELLVLSTTRIQSVETIITRLFIMHGYKRVQFKYIGESTKTGIEKNEFYLISDIQNIEAGYSDFLINTGVSEIQILIDMETHISANVVNKIEDKLTKTEKELFENNPSLYSLFEERKGYLQNNIKLNKRISSYKEILEVNREGLSYTESNSINEKRVIEITNFYHYEYEILPKWFKRLGHLIKVVMGKRSLKSLVNDNVEKYKNQIK